MFFHVRRREVDADAWHFGDPHFRQALFPAAWEDLGVRRGVRGALFEDEEVRDRRHQVQGSRRADRTVRVVRRDVDVVRLGHPRNLFCGRDPADPGEIRLKHSAGTLLEDLAEVVVRLQALAGRDRHVDGMLELRHRVDIFRRHRLLAPEHVERLAHLHDARRRMRVELGVHLDADIEVGARLADAGDHLSSFVDRLGRQLAVDRRVVAEEVGLPGGRALGHDLFGLFPVGRPRALRVRPWGAGVNAEALAGRNRPAAQQLVDRHTKLLADDVPEGDIDGAHGGIQRPAERVELRGVDLLPVSLDVPGTLAHQQLAGLANLRHHSRIGRWRRAFTPPVDALRRFDAHAGIAAAATAALCPARGAASPACRRRLDAHHVRLNLGDDQRVRLGGFLRVKPQRFEDRRQLGSDQGSKEWRCRRAKKLPSIHDVPA